uniref:Uncharacterized protein n=1 Tax=Romanomermis culicivorax TaxID=13658 RepID=A0A915JTZ3_ROMCU
MIRTTKNHLKGQKGKKHEGEDVKEISDQMTSAVAMDSKFIGLMRLLTDRLNQRSDKMQKILKACHRNAPQPRGCLTKKLVYVCLD